MSVLINFSPVYIPYEYVLSNSIGRHHADSTLLKPSIFINSATTGQNGWHVTEDIFKCISVNEKFCISMKISLKFVPKSLIDDKPAFI